LVFTITGVGVRAGGCGSIRNGWQEHLNGTAPSEYAEALALRRAVTLACNEGFNKVGLASNYFFFF
jgi:hypothetical protein